MENVIFIEKVKKLDKKQPERVITFNDYYERTVNKRRIEIGKKKYILHKYEISNIASQVNATVENIGARRLHTIIEKILDEISFTATDRAG